MDIFNFKRTSGGIRKIAAPKRKLRLSAQGKGVLNPQPKSPPIRRRIKDTLPKYLGIYFPDQPLFITIDPHRHLRAKTIRKLTDNTVDVKFRTKNGTRFIQGNIVAHGGKYLHALFVIKQLFSVEN